MIFKSHWTRTERLQEAFTGAKYPTVYVSEWARQPPPLPRESPRATEATGILYKKTFYEQQPLCVPAGGLRGSFQWQTLNNSTSFHALRVLTSRTWCEPPRLRICLWGVLIYLFFRVYNQVQQPCKAWADMLFFSLTPCKTSLHVSEWGWFGRPCKGPATLLERQNTFRGGVDMSLSIVLPKTDGTQADSHIPSLTLAPWLFLVLLPFPVDPGHLAALQDSIQQAVILKIFWIVMWQGWPVLAWKQPSYGIWNWPKQLPYWILF